MRNFDLTIQNSLGPTAIQTKMNFKLSTVFLVVLFVVATNALPKRPPKRPTKNAVEDEPESLADINKSKIISFAKLFISLLFYLLNLCNEFLLELQHCSEWDFGGGEITDQERHRFCNKYCLETENRTGRCVNMRVFGEICLCIP